MRFKKLSGIAEQPAKADKSAVGTVNRPLMNFDDRMQQET